MGEQEFFDLAGIDVLAAADHQVFDPAGDPVVAAGQPQGQIARVQPALGVDRRGGGLGILVIAQHHDVPPGAQFARLVVAQHCAGGRIDDFDFDARQRPADRFDAQLPADRRRGFA